jgi:hypothetical protein
MENGLIFKYKGWAFTQENGRHWLEYCRALYYGEVQGVSIYGPGEVAYDWPECVPEYIKERIISYSRRAEQAG